MNEPMKLETNDPNEALRQIASYLRTVDLSSERAVKNGSEVSGYWQCTEWLEGLKDMAAECDRLRNSEMSISTDPALLCASESNIDSLLNYLRNYKITCKTRESYASPQEIARHFGLELNCAGKDLLDRTIEDELADGRVFRSIHALCSTPLNSGLIQKHSSLDWYAIA